VQRGTAFRGLRLDRLIDVISCHRDDGGEGEKHDNEDGGAAIVGFFGGGKGAFGVGGVDDYRGAGVGFAREHSDEAIAGFSERLVIFVVLPQRHHDRFLSNAGGNVSGKINGFPDFNGNGIGDVIENNQNLIGLVGSGGVPLIEELAREVLNRISVVKTMKGDKSHFGVGGFGKIFEAVGEVALGEAAKDARLIENPVVGVEIWHTIDACGRGSGGSCQPKGDGEQAAEAGRNQPGEFLSGSGGDCHYYSTAYDFLRFYQKMRWEAGSRG
jgi:hypothetical protein